MSTKNKIQKPPEHEPGLHERVAIGDKAAVLDFMGGLAIVASVLDLTDINYSRVAALEALTFNLNAASLGPEKDFGVRLLMDTKGCCVPFSPDKPWSKRVRLDTIELTEEYIDNDPMLPAGHTLLKIIEEIVETGEFTDKQRDAVTALLPDYDN